MNRPANSNADSLDASVRLARLRKRMFAKVEVPRIAQYQLLDKIGGGGMGLVFGAWDPSLDRKIAIKVLRDAWSSGAGEQLRREAIALARLRHPAVVSVFEVGEHEGQVYLAMEYVEGETLRAWSRRWRAEEPRDPSRLLDVFVEAARGLAAAHVAEVVHRDVKPENIMIDADGRARLMDFGLARRTTATETTGADEPRGRSSADTESTVGLFGTPAYMAPEQLRGQSAGPAVDQFGLAACLYEALSGRRVRPILESEDVVLDFEGLRRFEPVLRRGLQDDPSARFGSMEAFADALGALRRRPGHRAGLWIGGIVAAAGVSVGVYASTREPQQCSASADRLEEVWNATRAQGLEEALVDPARPWTRSAWSRAREALDEYGQEWTALHRDTCKAGRVHGEISDAQMDQRMACLSDRRQRLDALASLLQTDGVPALASAETALDALPDLQACSDPAYLERQGHAPRDADAAEAVGQRLAEAATLQARGAPERARDVARAALELARRSDDAGAEARALLAVGTSHATLHESRDAHAHLVEAYERARAIPLLDVAAQAAGELARVSGLTQTRFDEGLWWLRIADLEARGLGRHDLDLERDLIATQLFQESGRSADALTRAERLEEALPDLDAVARARVELRLGWLHLQTGDHPGGTVLVEAAARRLQDVLGEDHPANADAHKQLSFAARVRGDTPLALSHAQRALALAESGVGARHVSLATYLASLAMGHFNRGDIDAAVAAIDRGLELDEPYPLEAVDRAKLYGRQGDVLVARDIHGALEAQTRAHTIARDAVGEQHRDTIGYLAARGEVLGELGHADEAQDALRTSLLLGRAVLGSEHPNVGAIHAAFGKEYQRQGDLEQALEHHRASVEIWERSYGRDAYALVGPLVNVCGVLGLLERPDDAMPACARARAIHEARDQPPSLPDLHNNTGIALLQLGRIEDAQAEFALARTAWRRVLGPGTYEESIVIANLASLAEQQGERARAAALYTEALEIRRATLGAEHPALAVPRDGLARTSP